MDNIFTGIPKSLQDEFFEVLLTDKNLKIERIVSRGHRSPASGWYDQEQNEWVMVVRGKATISYKDGKSVHLKTGDHIHIPAHTEHRVAWTDPDNDTIWLAVHYP